MRLPASGYILLMTLPVAFQLGLAQWRPTSGPGGGTVRSISALGSNVFIGGPTGVFRSSDNGASWGVCNTGLSTLNTFSILATPSSVFAGTAIGLFRSTNEGDVWIRVDSNTISHVVFCLTAHQSILYAGGGGGGVFKSTNGGTTWVSANSGLPSNAVAWCLTFIDSTLFAGTDNGVYFTTNQGASWFSLSNGLTNIPVYAVTRAGSTLLAGTSNSVFAYVPLSGSWQPSNAGLPSGDVWTFYTDGGKVYVGTWGDGVFVSSNSGGNWVPANAGFRNKNIWVIARSDSSLLAGSNGGGVYRSLPADGTTWKESNAGLGGYVQALASSNAMLYAGSGTGGFGSADTGGVWTVFGSPLDSKSVEPLHVEGQTAYAGTSDDFYSSTDNGATWVPNVALRAFSPGWILGIATSGSEIWCGGSNGMFYSSNAGSSWVGIGLAGKYIRSVVRSGSTLIAGAQPGLYTSTNNGADWVEQGYVNFTINALDVAGSTVVCTLMDGVLVSTDAGKNWEIRGLGVIGANLNDLVLSGGMIFAASTNGVHLSRTMGNNWTSVSSGLGSLGVQCLQPFGASLFAGTPRGVWRRSLAEMVYSLPEIPVLASPANSSTNQPVSTTLRWRKAIGADRYHIQVATSASFTSGIVVDDTSTVDTSKAVGGLLNSQAYYWRVAGRNSAGQGGWSDTWGFSTIFGIPSPVTLVSPVSGEFNVSTSPVLRWRKQSNVDTYHVRLGPDSQLVSGFLVNDSTLTDTSKIASGLLNGSTYYWKVRAKNTNGYGPWGSTWHFATTILTPDTVVLSSPSDGAVIWQDSVRFVWRQIPGSNVIYAFEIAIDSLFKFKIGDSSIVDTTHWVRGLSRPQRYWWHVKARNVAGWGPFSSANRFLVLPLISVDPESEIPSVFSLDQNYPNPFNPSTTISYGLPKASQVSLTVYSPLGQKVGDLVTGVKEAGYHTVTFDGSNLPSGVYFCRMQAGDFWATKKFILVR